MDTGNPSFFNRYAYTFNDPVNLTDPDGKNPAAGCAVGAVAGPVGCGVGAVVGTVMVVAVGAMAIDSAKNTIDQMTMNPGDLPSTGTDDVQSEMAPEQSIDDLVNSVVGPNVGPLPGETPADFTDRITRECRDSCIDQAVGEVGSGGDEMPPIGGGMGDKIGQCTHKCIDNILENVDDDDFD
jgi:hypothetical protein